MTEIEQQARDLWGAISFIRSRDKANKHMAVETLEALAKNGHPTIQKKAKQALKEVTDEHRTRKY